MTSITRRELVGEALITVGSSIIAGGYSLMTGWNNPRHIALVTGIYCVAASILHRLTDQRTSTGLSKEAKQDIRTITFLGILAISHPLFKRIGLNLPSFTPLAGIVGMTLVYVAILGSVIDRLHH